MTTENRLKLLETQVRGLLNKGSSINQEVDRWLYELREQIDDAEKAIEAMDHGALGGLSDDDHTQYLLVNCSRAAQGEFDIEGSGNDSATKSLHIVDSDDERILSLRDDARLKVGRGDADPAKTLDVAGNLNFDSVDYPVPGDFAAALAGAGAGNVDNGLHYYGIVYVTDTGETQTFSATAHFATVTVVDKDTDGKVQLTDIPISSDPRVIARKIYRSTADGSAWLANFYLVTISDNVTTTYLDNFPDSSLDTSDCVYRKINTTAGLLYVDETIIMMAPDGYHSAFGLYALENNTGWDVCAFGGYALRANTTGNDNAAFGISCLQNMITGNYNNAFGYGALVGVTSGSYNTAMGHNTLRQNLYDETAYCNAFGAFALYHMEGSSGNNYNNAFGYSAGRQFGGDANIFIGHYCGYLPSEIQVGDYNIFLGYYTGRLCTAGADSNILIGNQVNLPDTDGSNQLNIGNLLYGTGLGSSSSMGTGGIGIGITDPSARFQSKGTGNTSGTYAGLFTNSDDETIISMRDDKLVCIGGNLSMGSNWISNDGGSECISFGAAGDVGICVTANTTHRLRIMAYDDSDSKYALTVQDGDNHDLFAVRNDGFITTWGNNIALANGYISNDGGDEGLYVDTAGNCGICDNSPAARIHVKGYDQTSGYYCAKFTDSAGYVILSLRNDSAIGFYQATPVVRATTGGSESTHVQVSGNTVSDASTFDGYTLGQVVKALRNIGILT